MNPEKVLQKIEVDDMEQHEKELNTKLAEIQLYFADKKYLEQKDSEKRTFFDILKKYTPLVCYLEMEFNCAYAEDRKDFNEKYKKYFKEVSDNVNLFYDSQEDWQQKMLAFFEKKKQELLFLNNDKKERLNDDKVGLLKYNQYKTERAPKELFKHGFNKFDNFLEIHLEEFYKQEKKEIGLNDIRKSFSKLAELIVRDFSQTRAVLAESWLVDTQLLKRIGFRIIKKENCFERGATWWQLMDKNGQIKKKFLDKFIKDGKLPFKVAFGYITIEDLLKKFLPPEKRGWIVLKEIDIEFKNTMSRFEEIKKKISDNFDTISIDEIQSSLREIKVVDKWLETDDGKEFFGIIKKAKQKDIGRTGLSEAEKNRFKKSEKKLTAILENKKYMNKKVFIE